MIARITQLAAFLALGASAHLLLGALYVAQVIPQHKVTRSDEAFAAGPPRLSVLVVGDSMPKNAVEPTLLGPTAFNLAIGGENLLKTWYRLRWLLEHHPKEVEVVALPVGPASFTAWHSSDFAPEAVWAKYVDFLEVGRIRGEPMAWYGTWLKAHWFPYVGELRTLNQLRAGRFGFEEERASGFFYRLPEPWRRTSACESARLHFEGHRHDDPSLIWAFRSLLDWLRERSIPVVLVSYPVTREYSVCMAQTGAGKVVRAAVVDPIVAAGTPPLLEYHGEFFDRPELFADSFHLNPMGSVAFTRRLRDDLQGLGFLRAP